MTLIAFTGLLGCFWILIIAVSFWFFWTEPPPSKPRETYNQGVSAAVSTALGIAAFLLAVLAIINWWRL